MDYSVQNWDKYSEEKRTACWKSLEAMVKYCEQPGKCRHSIIGDYFQVILGWNLRVCRGKGSWLACIGSARVGPDLRGLGRMDCVSYRHPGRGWRPAPDRILMLPVICYFKRYRIDNKPVIPSQDKVVPCKSMCDYCIDPGNTVSKASKARETAIGW